MPSLAAIDPLRPAKSALRVRADELHDVAHGLDVDELPRNFIDALRQRAGLPEQHLVGCPGALDLLAPESAGLQALTVEACRARATPDHLPLWNQLALD